MTSVQTNAHALNAPTPREYVEVVYSPAARQVVVLQVDWVQLQKTGAQTGAGTRGGEGEVVVTVGDVLAASQLGEQFPDLDVRAAQVGIWGHKVALDKPVQVFERVEIYRPLQVDPKQARRLRSQKQGVLPSKCRPGYKGP